MDWQPADTLTNLNHYLHNWLLDTGSLTERIQSMCRQFRVHIVGQGNAPLHTSENNKLPLSESAYHVRETVLFADDVPWVFARSVIPTLLTQGEWKTLGTSPLGKQLFNDSRFTRGEFEVANLATSQLSGVINTPTTLETLYGRRSAFHFAGQDILVAEVFLPASPAYQGVI